MTNEWNEYKAYIGTPTYAVADKKDTSFLGRFTSDMIIAGQQKSHSYEGMAV